MRTQVMQATDVDTAWLEHIPAGGEPPEKTLLDSFPFSIGRSESANLRIESTRVSREHAVIERDGPRYRVRDNGSTNGTFLNGQRMDESALEDGDMLVIADVGFSFFCGNTSIPQQTATMMMPSGAAQLDGRDAVRDVIRGVRRLQEMLTHRAVESLFQPIVGLQNGELLGYQAIRHDERSAPAAPPAERLLMATECRLTGRLHQLFRMVAVEEAASALKEARLFVKLDPAEIGTRGLSETLGRLQSIYSGHRGLVVEVPDSAVCNTHHFRQFVHRLRALGVSLAFDGFASGKAQIMEFKEFPPDYVKLAPSVVRAIDRSSDRQRQVRSVVGAGKNIGCEVIAAGVNTKGEAAACRELGCQYAQGDQAGPPQSIHSLVVPAPT